MMAKSLVWSMADGLLVLLQLAAMAAGLDSSTVDDLLYPKAEQGDYNY